MPLLQNNLPDSLYSRLYSFCSDLQPKLYSNVLSKFDVHMSHCERIYWILNFLMIIMNVVWNFIFVLIILIKAIFYNLWLVRKSMSVNEHERLSSITLGHKLKYRKACSKKGHRCKWTTYLSLFFVSQSLSVYLFAIILLTLMSVFDWQYTFCLLYWAYGHTYYI